MADPVQPTYPVKETKTEKAKELAVWYAIQQDLEITIYWANLMVKNPQLDAKLLTGLWTAAIVY